MSAGRGARWALGAGRWALRARAAFAGLILLAAGRIEAQRTHLLIISGLSGQPKYTESFRAWGLALVDAARTRYGLPDSMVVYLAEEGVKDPRVRGVSTRANIEAELTRLASSTSAGDQIVIVLIGHGSGAAEASKISLPGPDMSVSDFATALDRFTTQQVAFVNMTSGSGDMLALLSAPNRVVITATKSSFERNESVFAKHFVAALTGDGADTDKDGRVSLLEAFRYATTETKRYYEQGNHLQTEHAQLDDDGDKKGTADPDARAIAGSGDGGLARRVFLGGGSYAASGGASDPKLAALYKERFVIEGKVEDLKKRKSSMSADAYSEALEALLVELAGKTKEIRALEGRP